MDLLQSYMLDALQPLKGAHFKTCMAIGFALSMSLASPVEKAQADEALQGQNQGQNQGQKQKQEKSTENPDPVYVFNRICYAQVPDVKGIQNMATKLAWRAIAEKELAEFKSYENPDLLIGWDAQVGERLFRVGLTQAPLSAKMKQTFPDFAKGMATSCSLVLDDQQDAALFMANMQTLAGRAPVSKDVPEGLLRTTTWAGGNEDFKVFLFAKAPPTGKGGLLNVTILQK